MPFGRERRLQAGHEAILLGQAIAGGQQVAQRNDLYRRFGVRGLRAAAAMNAALQSAAAAIWSEAAAPPI